MSPNQQTATRAEHEDETGTEKRDETVGRRTCLVLTLIDPGLGCLISDQVPTSRS